MRVLVEGQTVRLAQTCSCGMTRGTVESWDTVDGNVWVVMCMGPECVALYEVVPGVVIERMDGRLVDVFDEPAVGIEAV